MTISKTGEAYSSHAACRQQVHPERGLSISLLLRVAQRGCHGRIFMRYNAILNTWPAAKAAGPAGQAGTIRTEIVDEADALRCDLINMRRGRALIAITPQMVWSQRINIYIQNSHNCQPFCGCPAF